VVQCRRAARPRRETRRRRRALVRALAQQVGHHQARQALVVDDEDVHVARAAAAKAFQSLRGVHTAAGVDAAGAGACAGAAAQRTRRRV
jgi:hypothetical protein